MKQHGYGARLVDFRWALFAIVLLATFLRFADLESAGLANLFYASTIRSMGISWHNFFYAAFDPAATISVDKPPLALWFQVLSTKVFGFNGFAMILPIAFVGVIGVAIAFALGRRSHGVHAGLFAALFLAVFPESVATSRDTTMDTFIMALLGLAAMQLLAAVEEERPWLLVGFAATLGVAFNVKFFQAAVILPAALIYIFFRYRTKLSKLLLPLSIAFLVGTAISLSWISVVELTPAGKRPLVMNDMSNSAYGLAFRYNGLERIVSPRSNPLTRYVGTSGTERSLGRSSQFGIGESGFLRLIKPAYGALLGFGTCLSLGGFFVVLCRNREWFWRGPGLFWGMWLLTGVGFFSASYRAPAHYTESYVLAIAVMVGVGLVEAWRATCLIRGSSISAAGLIGRLFSASLLPAICTLLLVYAAVIYRNMHPMSTPVLTTAAIGVFAISIQLMRGSKRNQNISQVCNWIGVLAVFLVMLITSLWVALAAPRGGQLTAPNPIPYVWSKRTPNIEDRRVPTDEILQRYQEVLPEAKYRFAISAIKDAGESIADTGASVLPIWNDYLDTGVIALPKLRSFIENGDIPVILVDRRFHESTKFRPMRVMVQGVCRPASKQTFATWMVYECF